MTVAGSDFWFGSRGLRPRQKSSQEREAQRASEFSRTWSSLLESSLTSSVRSSMRTSLLAIVIALGCCISAVAQLDDILKKADATLQQRDTSSLSDSKIVAGLKQALEISTSKAVAATGRPDGFLKNEAIKISLPPKLETVGRGLRLLG